jgi:hypothetical protein
VGRCEREEVRDSWRAQRRKGSGSTVASGSEDGEGIGTSEKEDDEAEGAGVKEEEEGEVTKDDQPRAPVSPNRGTSASQNSSSEASFVEKDALTNCGGG